MVMNKPYKEGTIKLTWINLQDSTILESSMHNSIEHALETARKTQLGEKFLIMELIITNGKQYKWKLLPYGEFKEYIVGMKFKKSILLKITTFSLIFLGTLYIYNILSKKL